MAQNYFRKDSFLNLSILPPEKSEIVTIEDVTKFGLIFQSNLRVIAQLLERDGGIEVRDWDHERKKGTLGDHSLDFSTSKDLYGRGAIGNYSTVFGLDTRASGRLSFAIGDRTDAAGENSFAGGTENQVSGKNSTVFGETNSVSGESSFISGGVGNEVTGNYAHAEGKGVYAVGEGSHAEGSETKAQGVSSHSEGIKSITEGEASHSEGKETIAKGDYSHTEGENTISYGRVSHTEGIGVVAVGEASHAEGIATQSQITLRVNVFTVNFILYYMMYEEKQDRDYTNTLTIFDAATNNVVATVPLNSAGEGSIDLAAGTYILQTNFISVISWCPGDQYGLWTTDLTNQVFKREPITISAPMTIDEAYANFACD